MTFMPWMHANDIYICIWDGGSLGLIVWGSRGLHLCYYCFMWMYLEWACSLTCHPSLWHYQLPGFSTSGGLSACLNGSTLVDCLPFPCREYRGWAKTHHFLFTSTFPWFPVFPPLLTPRQYSALDCCLLGLLFNNNNIYICISHMGDLNLQAWWTHKPLQSKRTFFVCQFPWNLSKRQQFHTLPYIQYTANTNISLQHFYTM